MEEVIVVWMLTLITQMGDGSINGAAILKESRRQCMQDLGEVAAMVDEAKTSGKVRSYTIECNPYELKIVRKYQ